MEQNKQIIVPGQSPVAPTTTSEQDLRTAGQRRLNMIWEMTQAGIAISTVLATFSYGFIRLLSPRDLKDESTVFLNAFFLIIGFYFGRTNHARIGDLGHKNLPDGKLDDRST